MLNGAEKIRWILARVLLAFFIGLFVTGIITVLTDELLSFNSTSALSFGILIGFSSFAITLAYISRPGGTEEDGSTRSIVAGLKALAFQKLIAAAGTLTLGLAAAVVAGQTIIDAATSSEKLTVATPATVAYENLLQQQSELLSNISAPNTDSGAASINLAIEGVSNALQRLEQSGRLEAEVNIGRNRQSIDGAFLFGFFSNLLVRIGTIMILLYLFSVLVREYRRIDKRHLELQQILLSTKLQLEGFDIELIKRARSVIKIDDTPNKSDTNETDTLFAEKFSRDIASPLKEVAEAIRSSTIKPA